MPIRPPAIWDAALGLAILLASTAVGCFDSNALVEAQVEEANLATLDEVDLGEFRVTMPHLPGDPGGGMVSFHAFGQVLRRERKAAASLLTDNSPELRYRILLLVRSLPHKSFHDPKLTALRAEIKSLANTALGKKLVKRVGFYRFVVQDI